LMCRGVGGREHEPGADEAPSCSARTETLENVRPERSTSTLSSMGPSNVATLANVMDADVTRCEGTALEAATIAWPRSWPPSTTLRLRSWYPVPRNDRAALLGVEQSHEVVLVAPDGEAVEGNAVRETGFELDADLSWYTPSRPRSPRPHQRVRVGPHDILEGRVAGKRPVVGLPFERADGMALDAFEQPEAHIGLGEVEALDMVVSRTRMAASLSASRRSPCQMRAVPLKGTRSIR